MNHLLKVKKFFKTTIIFLWNVSSISVLFFSLTPKTCLAQTNLSRSAEIHVLTIGQGSDLYSAFGHTGIRVLDDSLHIDWVFNYGTFDFDTPHFYLKFMRGQLDYQLAINPFYAFQEAYKSIEKRSIIQQSLALTLAEKEALFDFLQNNYKPQNRAYRYDFFFDNCATRPRDVIEKVLGNSLNWNFQDSTKTSFRTLLDSSLVNWDWANFGIDLALGTPTDVIASPRNKMFLPEYLMRSLADAQVIRAGNSESLVARTDTLFWVTPAQPSLNLPLWIAWFLAVSLAIWYLLAYFKLVPQPTIGLFKFCLFLAGIVGLVAFILWFLTEHKATVWNWNLLLWAWVSHLIFVFTLKRSLLKSWQKVYLLVYALTLLLTLLFWNYLPQMLHIAVFPIILILLLMSVTQLLESEKSRKSGGN